MKISASSGTTEHWLTLMTCTICNKTPDNSPVYKCNYGHTICYACFQGIARDATIPECNICGSKSFTRHDVSDDFLRKLKTKPGIGRPCRYDLEDKSSDQTIHADNGNQEGTEMTVEELFQLPKAKITQLFDECTQEKLKYLSGLTATECIPRRVQQMALVDSITNAEKTSLKDSKFLMEAPTSRKPLKCPHDPCNKIIALSSFKMHFKCEHFDMKRYSITRGTELSIPFDPGFIEHGKSLCLGIIQLVALDSDSGDRNSRMEPVSSKRMQDSDTFWLMVTGSVADNPLHAHVLFWVFNHKEETNYNCTMELSSAHNMITMTTFCKINGIYESQSVNKVAKKQNCLYVAYGTMKSMLIYGPMMKFRLTLH